MVLLTELSKLAHLHLPAVEALAPNLKGSTGKIFKIPLGTIQVLRQHVFDVFLDPPTLSADIIITSYPP